MTQPEALSKNEPLTWSTGTGTDVWALFCACRVGDVSAIRTLLEKDASLVRCHYDYRTPMYFAVRENQVAAAALLLERGANPVNSGTSDTLLQMAKDRGYAELATMLEKALAGDHQATPGGEMIAAVIRNRDLTALKELLHKDGSIVHARDSRSNQPIHWAVMTRQPDMVKELLAHGADIDAKRADSARPLQLCNGDYDFRGWRDVPKDVAATPRDMFNLLIGEGAYLDIGMAALIGNTSRVRELLDENPALVNHMEYVTYYAGSGPAIKNAAQGGHIEIVSLLLERGADPNLPEEGIAPKGRALHEAVVNRHREIVELLLKHGAHPNVPVESSADTLTMALEQDDPGLVELLCTYGAARDVPILAYYGDIKTAAAVFAANPEMANDPYALECAVMEGHESFVKLMLRYQPNLPSKIAVGVRSKGPQDVAKSESMIELLFRHGMNASYRNWLGITPLHTFAKKGDLENAKLFLKHGADINAVDEELSATPLGYAIKYGQEEMVRFLLENGARQ